MKTEVKLVDTRRELAGIEPDWRQLFNRLPQAPPFLSPDWLMPWWQIFGASSEPLAVGAWQGGRLCGFLPTRVYENRIYFIGHGLTDQLDALAESRSVAGELWAALQGTGLAGELAELPAHSSILAVCEGSQPSSVSPAADLRAFQLRPKLATNLRQARRRLDRLGEVTFETAEPRDSSECLDALISLHSNRWTASGRPGMLDEPAVQRFHHCAASRMATHRLARFHCLRLDGRLVGVLYALVRNATVFYYLSGYDPRLAPFSPGSLLIEFAINTARAQNEHTFDFLRGEEAYKYAWGAMDRPQFVAFLTGNPGELSGLALRNQLVG